MIVDSRPTMLPSPQERVLQASARTPGVPMELPNNSFIKRGNLCSFHSFRALGKREEGRRVLPVASRSPCANSLRAFQSQEGTLLACYMCIN